ncbi:MarR family winged helix-turn-helix transcriptional regulator [Nocardia sp. NPDC127526]|uniref:MarR family winged helix-turn-helix transcriptional regulator n=1 Tax=Nocardia sp. NPDC127526 TaxID=3345393 RepID=UPI0036437806
MPDQRDSAPAIADHRIGVEARAASGDHLDVRTWLRLLATTNEIEQEIRTRLRERFGTTLARFDFLAQLERHRDGLRMSALSRYLMVTGGNVTGLTDQLVGEGWVERIPDPIDKRATLVRLTRLGRTRFAEMAAEHERWLGEIFAGFGDADQQTLYELLGKLRVHLAHPSGGDPAVPPTNSTGLS